MTTSIDILRKSIDKLENLADEVEQLAQKLFEEVPLKYDSKYSEVSSSNYYWKLSDDNLKRVQRDVVQKYQRYSSSSYQLVKEHLSEREQEFAKYYGDDGGQSILLPKNWTGS